MKKGTWTERKTTIEAFGSCVKETELHYRKCT